MSERKRLAVAVLAAGASQRFGEHDKLNADFRGEKLGLHAASSIPRDRFANAWVISAKTAHPCAPHWRDMGYDVRANMRSGEGMGTSVALAASLATLARADALLIALADMPLVPESHFAELADRALSGGDDFIGTSAIEDTRLPPAVFGSEYFADLAKLTGGQGGHAILSEGAVIDCPDDWLVDIDTPETLALLS